MRMWMVPPTMLCDQHLLGEHVELHMFVGTIRRGVSIAGYVLRGLVETANIKKRHRQLVKEMKARGFRHKSKLEYEDKLAVGKVSRIGSIRALTSRCKECAERIDQHELLEIK